VSPRHHLDPATIVSHAAGALSPEVTAIVTTHLAACAHCRAANARAEAIGGVLVMQQQPALPPDRQAQLRADMLARLDSTTPAPPRPASPPPATDPDQLPLPLQRYFGARYSDLAWRWMGPGMHFIRKTGPSGGTLLLLRIGPGKSMPMHGHGGSEITQILQGAYDDALGHFAAGDVADLDGDTVHQPVTAAGAPCICVAALDAKLRFPGWIARALQPIFGI
jgi:putative transcriptional regulator